MGPDCFVRNSWLIHKLDQNNLRYDIYPDYNFQSGQRTEQTTTVTNGRACRLAVSSFHSVPGRFLGVADCRDSAAGLTHNQQPRAKQNNPKDRCRGAKAPCYQDGNRSCPITQHPLGLASSTLEPCRALSLSSGDLPD